MSRRRFVAAALAVATASVGFRLIDLGGNPKGFFCDEASIAFNARSLLETGRDEHGVLLPVFFQAFGDYKPPFYVYATAASLSLFPADVEWATRLPAALFLSAFLVPVMAIVRRRHGAAAAVAAGSWLALQPWLNHASHIAFGLSLTPLLLATAFWLWLRWLDGSAGALRLAALVFALAFYSYPAARAFVPLFVAGLLVMHRDAFRGVTGRRRLAEFALVAVVAAIPFLVYAVRAPGFFERTRYLNVFTSDHVTNSGAYRWLEPRLRDSAGGFVLEHDVLLRPLLAAMNYASYYSPVYLFRSGDVNLKFGTTRFGPFGPAAAVGLLVGIVAAWRRRDRIDRALLWWLALYGLPGALTWEEVPHAGRGIVGHPGLDLLAVAGLAWVVARLRSPASPARPGWIALAAVVASLETAHTVRYYRYYRFEYSRDASAWMQYGFRQMMDFVAAHHERYPRAVLVTTGMHYLPEVFALLYSQTPASEWRRTGRLPWGLEVRHELPAPGDWREDTLYVLAPVPGDLDPGLERLGGVRWESGGEAFGYFAVASTAGRTRTRTADP